MARVGIVGSGNVGANTAFFIAEKGVADVFLYDIEGGSATGKALDMMEAAPIRGYRRSVHSTDQLQVIGSSDVVLIAAGAVRKPGERREDLFDENRPVIEELAGSLSGLNPKVVVVTEPVDLLTTLFIRESRLPPNSVMGLGCLLDSMRLKHLLARELEVSPEKVTALVIGRHSDAMIPLLPYCRVSGIPVSHLIPEKRLGELLEETKGAGDLIVRLAQRTNAYYGPAAVATELTEAILTDSRRVLPVSLLFTGQYGIEGMAMSLPVVIGWKGTEQVLTPTLTGEQETLLRESADFIRSTVGSSERGG
jgi:malate dehydrogenase